MTANIIYLILTLMLLGSIVYMFIDRTSKKPCIIFFIVFALFLMGTKLVSVYITPMEYHLSFDLVIKVFEYILFAISVIYLIIKGEFNLQSFKNSYNDIKDKYGKNKDKNKEK